MFRVKGVDGLDQPDGADGDQILHTHSRIVKFFSNVDYQAQIVLNQSSHNKTKLEVSIDEPLNVDWDGNELLLSDILGTDEDVIYRDIENEVERPGPPPGAAEEPLPLLCNGSLLSCRAEAVSLFV